MSSTRENLQTFVLELIHNYEGDSAICQWPSGEPGHSFYYPARFHSIQVVARSTYYASFHVHLIKWWPLEPSNDDTILQYVQYDGKSTTYGSIWIWRSDQLISTQCTWFLRLLERRSYTLRWIKKEVKIRQAVLWLSWTDHTSLTQFVGLLRKFPQVHSRYACI